MTASWNKLIAHASLAADLPAHPVARVICARLMILCLLAGCSGQPELEAPVPGNLDQLEPQLRDYLAEKVKWVQQAPREPDRHALLGIVYSVNALWPEALRAFQNTVQLNPKEPLAHLYVAVATEELGDFPAALLQYQEITTRFPNFAPGFARWGHALLRAGQAADAESAFHRLMVLAPQEWRAFAGLGVVKLRQGNFAEAIPRLQKAIELSMDAKVARHLLGSAYRGIGRLEEARRELLQGVNATYFPMPDAWSATAPQHMKLLQDQYEIADAYAAQGQPEKAVVLLEQAFAYHPENLEVMNNLGIAYNRSGQPLKGRALLEKVIAKDNRNVAAYVALAVSCQMIGLRAEALSAAGKAIELAPDLAQPHLVKANALLASEQFSEAVSALQAALQCDPRNPEICLEIGDVMLRSLKRPQEALAYFRLAVQLDPALLAGYVRLVDVYLRLGKASDARQAFEGARKLSPSQPVYAFLEQRLEQLERPPK